MHTAAARAHPENHKVLQSWAVMEAKKGCEILGENLGKEKGAADDEKVNFNFLAGLAVARPLFQRAAHVVAGRVARTLVHDGILRRLRRAGREERV